MKCSVCKTEMPDDAILCSLGGNWWWSVACQPCTQQPRSYYDRITIRWKRSFDEPKPCDSCGRLIAKPTNNDFREDARRFCSGTCASRYYYKPKPLIWIPCQQCGETFQAKRSDAKYCSTRCRVAAHRKGNTP